MNSFEVHETGTHRELWLSRQLANEIAQVTEQYGLVVPQSILEKYTQLKAHYDWQRETKLL